MVINWKNTHVCAYTQQKGIAFGDGITSESLMQERTLKKQKGKNTLFYPLHTFPET